MRIMLAVAVLLLADCALGSYLDWSMRRTAPLISWTHTKDDVSLVRDCAVSIGQRYNTALQRTEMIMRSVPCDADIVLRRDAALELVKRPNTQEQRAYTTFTDSGNNGFFWTRGRWWRFTWHGHDTPFIAPSWH